MLDTILIHLITFIENMIEATGPLGISLLMAIESCNIPLPSETIMPFAGYLVSKGEMNFHVAAFAGAFGCVLGSVPSYYIGYFGGRPFFEKYGKWLLVSKKDLDEADEWVDKYGDWAFFICRMLPVVRTFISLPAGILKARKRTFYAHFFRLAHLVLPTCLCGRKNGAKYGYFQGFMAQIRHRNRARLLCARYSLSLQTF